MKILVVAAHPDDEVLGCGGTIARLAKQGHSVSINILGQGLTSRFKRPDQADSDELKALHDCSRRAGKLLGAKDVSLFDLPDNRFDTVPLLDVVKNIEDQVQRLQPEVVYTHHSGDLNIDHLISHRAVLTATRPTVGQPVKEIYGFEVPSSTEWAFSQFQPAFSPNFFVDITDTLDTKIEAMKLYKTETREFPHPRSAQALTALAQYRGSSVGMKAAEAFVLLRKLIA
jgi:LmbE family N-acetylglucosaminyl deacetylase